MSTIPRPFTILSGGGAISSSAVIADNSIVRGDGGARGVQGSVLSIADTTGTISGFGTGGGLTLHGGWTLTGASGVGTITGGTVIAGTNTLKFGATAAATIGVVTDATDGILRVTPPATGPLQVYKASGAMQLNVIAADNTNYSLVSVGVNDGTQNVTKLWGAGTANPGTRNGFSMANFSILSAEGTNNAGLMIDVANAAGFYVGTNANLRMTINSVGSTTFVGSLACAGATVSTSTGIITPVGTTALSSLRIPHGVAPTSPVDGDVWSTTTTLNFRLNGVTKSITMI